MPPDLTAAFRATGLSHLTAVSGENVAILFGTVTALVRRAGVRRRARVVVAAGALAAFVVLVRPTPSVLRAAVMGGLVLVGMLRGRRAAPVPLLAAAVLGLVVVDPFLARSAGFALSVLATSAIVIVAPRWTDRLAVHMPRPLAAAVAVPAAAQLACTPVIVAVFGQLTPWAVPANLLAAPAVAPATVAGMATAMTAVVVRGPAEAQAWAAAVPTRWLAAVARGLAHLPGGATRWPRGAPVGFAAAVVVVVGLVALVHGRWRPTPRGMLTAWRR
jgi:competence protein ComEC